MFTSFRAMHIACRLGLLYTGTSEKYLRTNDEGDGIISIKIHASCKTDLNTGIDSKGMPVYYCRRCEKIIEEDFNPLPRGGAFKKQCNVISFQRRQ